MKRCLVFGASRGLGAELVKAACSAGHPVTGFARKEAALEVLRSRFPSFVYQLCDLSTADGQDRAIAAAGAADVARVFLVAGGGPYGLFGAREWKDHEWAWQVSFRFQARLLHALARNATTDRQVIAVGSAVAESEADPKAASYSAAKHALKGLVLSLRMEYPQWDLRLFSPGYMDTEMLPPNTSARARGVYNPSDVARELWNWSLSADNTGHRVYPRHPGC